MADFHHLPSRDDDGSIHVVVESPRGSTVKLAYDPELGAFVFKRPLLLGVTYPFDWGFVPSTSAPDGDPLDAMVMFDSPTWPGTIIPATPIGVVKLTQREKRSGPRIHNDRILAVPTADPRYSDVTDLPRRVREELERFFLAAAQMTGKHVRIEGWGSAGAADKIVRNAIKRYSSKKKS